MEDSFVLQYWANTIPCDTEVRNWQALIRQALASNRRAQDASAQAATRTSNLELGAILSQSGWHSTEPRPLGVKLTALTSFACSSPQQQGAEKQCPAAWGQKSPSLLPQHNLHGCSRGIVHAQQSHRTCC